VGVSHIATLERVYDIFNRRAFEEAGPDLFPDDFVYHPLPQALEPEPIKGRDALLEFLELDLFRRQWVEMVEVSEVGDFILASIRTGGETVSGAVLDQAGFQVWRFENGVPRECWLFNERAEAERKAGIRA
jgi:hypothetical protein